MPTFYVYFFGEMTMPLVDRLSAAQVVVPHTGKDRGLSGWHAYSARHLAVLEAFNADEAVAVVRTALGPDSASFRDWAAVPSPPDDERG